MQRLGALEASAHTVTTIARVLVGEDREKSKTDVLVWAEAMRAEIQGHARDLDAIMPWSRLLDSNAVAGPTSGLTGTERRS